MKRAQAIGGAALGLVLSVAAGTACREGFNGPSLNFLPLATTAPWKLQTMQKAGGLAAVAPGPDRFNVLFDAQGTVTAQADCNRCTGSYTATGTNRVTVGELACTRAACSSTPFDTDYARMLTGPQSVAIDATALALLSARGTLRFSR